jgi:hypothetical protein
MIEICVIAKNTLNICNLQIRVQPFLFIFGSSGRTIYVKWTRIHRESVIKDTIRTFARRGNGKSRKPCRSLCHGLDSKRCTPDYSSDALPVGLACRAGEMKWHKEIHSHYGPWKGFLWDIRSWTQKSGNICKFAIVHCFWIPHFRVLQAVLHLWDMEVGKLYIRGTQP